ncbi:MAG TPA: hypothetical protein VNO21_17710, partial [Polyangiaceae bacterium]|nr:hypothetical protein [Polyangiaceae bacterium]
VACVSFHRFARGALSVKRWLRGKKNIDEATRAEFVGTVARLPFAEDAALWKNDLRALANPPRGRISQLVFEHVGRAMGVSALEVRLLVFGPNRRERVNRC